LYLVVYAFYQPSKEPRYNVGGVLMHLIILYFYIVTLLLNPRLDMKGSFVNNMKAIDQSLVVSQVFLCLYLVLVSFWKLKQLWDQAHAQVQREREAEAIVEEHLKYFEQLRLHFSDPVAVMLTRMHHHGGMDAAIADAAMTVKQTRHDQGRQGKKSVRRLTSEQDDEASSTGDDARMAYANPLMDASGGDDDDDDDDED
jgi:hypothetical protein